MTTTKFQPPARQAQLAAGADSEIHVQVSTAKRYPRDVQVSLQKARQLATLDEETAEECHYSFPRAGKNIEGPSVRLAEIVASTWGNLRVGSRVIEIGEREVVVEGACIDLENNVAVAKEVRRKILDKNGQRFNEDMIGLTANAASSIAVRNALLMVIPKPFWNQVYEATLRAIHDGKKPLAQRRQAVLTWFVARGVTEPQVAQLLGKKNAGEIMIDDLKDLIGLRNAISEGTTNIAEVFGLEAAAPGVKRSLSLRKPASEVVPAASGERPAPPTSAQAPPQEPDDDPFTSSSNPNEPVDGSPPIPSAPISAGEAAYSPASSAHPFATPGEDATPNPPSPASSDEPETGPEGEIAPATPPAPSAKDEIRKLALDLGGGKVQMARAILRRVSKNRWDSPLHPACTEEECARVLEVLRDEWLKKRGGEIGREPGEEG